MQYTGARKTMLIKKKVHLGDKRGRKCTIGSLSLKMNAIPISIITNDEKPTLG